MLARILELPNARLSRPASVVALPPVCGWLAAASLALAALANASDEPRGPDRKNAPGSNSTPTANAPVAFAPVPPDHELASLWNDPDFARRLVGSYGFLSDREPRLTPDEQAAYRDKVLPLLREDPKRAIPQLEALAKPGSSAVFDYTLGTVYFQNEDLTNAVARFEAALAKFPDFLRAQKNLALARVRGGDYRGKNQFWFALQEPGKKDSGGEWNGEPNEANASNAPVANFQVWNATFIGAGVDSSGNNGLTVRVYAAPEVYQSIFTQFGGVGLRITDDKAGQCVASGLMKFRENLWFALKSGAAGDRAAVFFDTAAYKNQQVDPQLRSVSRIANGGLDPRPLPGSPALAATTQLPPCDGFLDPVSYRGAFGAGNWLADWTHLAGRGVATAVGGVTPLPIPCTPSASIELTVAHQGGNIALSFPSETGKTYRVQSRPALGAGVWTDDGTPLAGTGQVLTFTDPEIGRAHV